ncbi:Glycosyltransferase involved in cell wall bisynthesis [Nitrosovibrio sp. Nv4]|nr:Glycosyltransferase involved in cell wall bisynthesis [Nitrosovibrio sp. Nv4]
MQSSSPSFRVDPVVAYNPASPKGESKVNNSFVKRYIKSIVRRAAKYAGNGCALQQTTWGGYTRDALRLANKIDCLPEQLLKPQQHPERVAVHVKDRICNWYLPRFANPFYGGIMTILRLADYLQRCHGIKQRILICGNSESDEVSANIIRAFPALSKAEVIILNTGKSLIEIPPADYSVATLWSTAYVLLGVENTGYKFYMIQDFEPAFYPAGSTYAQAELSYYFGFYGIANTQSLKEIYERDYGGCAVLLRPSIDKTVFYPSSEEKAAVPKRLFYYGRPGTPRNGFELAAVALRRLKQQYGNSIDIICAGARWNPADYNLNGVVRSLGMLPYPATGDLYRSCHLGLVMMMTKHPSYLPFELMASGAIVVTNFNQANTWLLKDGENCLISAPSASCLAVRLSYGLDHYDELASLRQRAANQILADAGDWDTSLGEVAKFILEPPPFISSNPF